MSCLTKLFFGRKPTVSGVGGEVIIDTPPENCRATCVHAPVHFVVLARSSYDKFNDSLRYQWFSAPEGPVNKRVPDAGARVPVAGGSGTRVPVAGGQHCCMLKLESQQLLDIADHHQRPLSQILFEVEVTDPVSKNHRRLPGVSIEYRNGTAASKPIIFSKQPAPVMLEEGADAIFEAVLEARATCSCGKPLYTVQWQRDGEDLPSETRFCLKIPAARPQHEGCYTCKVSAIGDIYASATSDGAALRIIQEPPYIIPQCADSPTSQGKDLTSDAIVALTLNKLSRIQSASIASVAYRTARRVTLSPEDAAACLGDRREAGGHADNHATASSSGGGAVTVRRECCAVGGIVAKVVTVGATSHQWFRDETPLAGQTTTSLSLSLEDVEAMPTAIYQYIGSNSFGPTSSELLQVSSAVVPLPQTRKPADLEALLDGSPTISLKLPIPLARDCFVHHTWMYQPVLKAAEEELWAKMQAEPPKAELRPTLADEAECTERLAIPVKSLVKKKTILGGGSERADVAYVMTTLMTMAQLAIPRSYLSVATCSALLACEGTLNMMSWNAIKAMFDAPVRNAVMK
ncbi:hypothetical protein CYMTET_6932 [Cymbomonas tetramitiformis]|uniref:Ig-like domain-containing protein n=1 Tax=Cymbomonas tetramitiformis TaxID=36881 RepID=A0AAE0GWF7_9CHLO|nr:hypothetical protein CYMTET_6932 [Cymbomonas tetramitiformis]